MTTYDPKLIQRLAREELARRQKILAMKEDAEKDFLVFIKMFWHILEPETPLVEGWVLETLCDALMAVTDGHIKRLIINVFPGAMKSLILNVFWPAWEWGPCGMPWLRYITASYATSLPERDNGRFRRLISDPLYQKCWGDKVTVDKDSVEIVENSRTGWKRVLSIGGTTTGWRGNRVLIDDANNPMSVESDDVRHGTNIWLREVMPDRLNDLDRDVIINIQQRTHMQDATETLVQSWNNFVWISIPMEFDPLRIGQAVLRREEDGTPMETWTDPRSLDANGNQLEGLYNDDKGELKVRMGSPMAHADGELAWPERFSPEAVADLKKAKASYAWAGQYQQSPTIRGGGIIRRDWWQIWSGKTFPDMGTVVASLDTAQEEHKEADYNALTCWGAFPGANGEPKLMLTTAWRDRLPLAQLVARVAEICRERKVDYLLIEHKTRGRDVHDEIVRLYQNAAWQTVLIKVKDDKTSRLNAVSHLFSGDVRKDPVTGLDTWAGGMIYAPDTQWADDVINEVGAFPRAPHDDYCFVAGTMIATRRGAVPIETVTTADECLTPIGWRPVLAAGLTGVRSVSTHAGLTGTSNHPVFTLDKGFQPLDTISLASKTGDLSLCGLIRTTRHKQFNSKASPIASWAVDGNTISPNQPPTLAGKIQRACMSLFGKMPPARPCRQIMKSTTRTAIPLIASLTIWSAYRKVCIARFLRDMQILVRSLSIWKTFVRLLLNGIVPKLAASGIGNMPRKAFGHQALPSLIPKLFLRNGFARGVERNSYFATIKQNSAAHDASPKKVDIAVESISSSIPIMRPVFNLTVADAHCYYANGILVHNCDTVSMALGWMRKNGVVLRKVEYDDQETDRKKFRRTQSVPYAI